MTRFRAALALAALVPATVVLPAAAVATASGPVASAAATCGEFGPGSSHKSLGPMYIEALTTKGVSCSTAESFAHAYYECGLHHGGVKGRCTSLEGYRCSERRQYGFDSFIGKSRCTKGRDSISETYTQST
ncbi:MAG TPA: hypothetical protein VHX88_20850 [Solirubrobacteraceae bacterium]|nr:hypothetical protein [Solirubrobacteraceae bacterium]